MTNVDDLCAFSVTICRVRADCIAMFTLLFIEDDEAIRTALRLVLEDEGYEVAVAGDGETGLKMFSQIDPDLVLLDLRLPDISGFEVCRSIRRTSITPVIMVTAQTDTSDLVNGFDAGADDYVTKPYSSRELIARIKAVLRRGITDDGSIQDQDLMEVGPVKLNIGKHQVSVNGSPVSLPLKEFELLEFLMRNSGRVLTRSQLIDRVWGGDYYGDTKTLDVHIKRLRAKIEADPANPVLIQTIRGLGYKLENI
jgi:two-component system response regulator RegX3